MITSIFNKSKPINYISVFFLVLLGFIIMLVKHNLQELSVLRIFQLTLNFILVNLCLFVLNFVVKKNTLTKDNNFTSLCFGLFVISLPQIFLNTPLLLSHLFILLAFRRLASLSSNRNTIKKLLDSGIFIALASLCYFWSIWFLILPIIALIYHQENKINYWLIPMIGFLSITIIAYGLWLFFPEFITQNLSVDSFSFNFSAYNTLQIRTFIILIIVLSIWTLWHYIPRIKKRKRALWPIFRLTFYFLIVSFISILFSSERNSTEFLLLVSPFSIICANYFQIKDEKWFKEILLWTWLALGLLIPFMS